MSQGDERNDKETIIICEEKELFESKTLSDYDIGEKAISVIVSARPSYKRVFLTCVDDGVRFSIEVHDLATIQHIKQFIYDKIEENKRRLNEISLIFQGRQLEDEKTVTEYDIPSGATLNFIYTVASGNTVVMVHITRAENNTGLFLQVDPSYTVKHLKSILYFSEGIPCDEQRIVYQARQLRDENQLSDYGITSNSSLQLHGRVQGGGLKVKPFQLTDVTNLFEIHQPSDADRSYRQFGNGVNSEGVCVNNECVVYLKQFVCQHGYGVYRVNEDLTRCPECRLKSPRVESCGFSRANVIIRAMPLGLKGQQAVIRSNLSEAEGNYAYLPHLDLASPDNNMVYEFIEVLSCTPDCSVTLGKQLCSVCGRTLYLSDHCDHGLKSDSQN